MGSSPNRTIAVVGMGSIGVAFALVFARAGYTVQASDPDPERLALVHAEVSSRLAALGRHGLTTEDPQQVLSRIRLATTIEEAVADADLVQECAPERLEVKQELFARFDAAARPDAVLASSSSALTASQFASGLSGRGCCLVAHPGNPPYLLPVIELVPAPFTEGRFVDAADAIYTQAGLRPVRVNQEIEGFVFNRLQGALLREAYCLVRDGVASVEDVDRVVREGLGLRWSFMGPFETVDLNTRGGIESHAQKMGPAYARMGAQRGQDDPWTPELVQRVAAERRSLVPLADWEARVAWRDEQLINLIHFKEEAIS
jgi:L-gulonate 3-dehydrogenase